MNDIDFDELCEDYIGVGLLLSFIIGLVICAIHAIVFDEFQSRRASEIDFYHALQGQEISTQLTDAEKAAQEIKALIKRPRTALAYNQRMKRLSDYDGGLWADIFQKNDEKIIASINEPSINLAEGITVTPWKTFRYWWYVLFPLILIIGMTVNHVVVTIQEEESLLKWPWKKWWVYPLILFMSPALVPCTIVELIWRGLVFLYVEIISKTINRNVRYKKMPRHRRKLNFIWFSKLKENREAQKRIQEVQKKIKETRERWPELYWSDTSRERELTAARVETLYHKLSQLGLEVTRTQRELADQESRLASLVDNVNVEEVISPDKCLEELDQLLKHPLIEAVEVYGDDVWVYTGTICMDYEFRRIEIGKFIIKLCREIEYSRIRFENLCSTHPKGRHHPFTSSDDFCFGNLSDSIRNAIARREYAVAFEFVITQMQRSDGLGESLMEYKEVQPKW